MHERSEPHGRDPSGTIGRNLEPYLLIELLRAPSYGYDLIKRLGDYGFRRATNEPAVVYKVLRALEDTGAIQSQWSMRESGPARRYYEITETGRQSLRDQAFHLYRTRERIDRLVREYIAMTDDDLTSDRENEDAAATGAIAVGGRQ